MAPCFRLPALHASLYGDKVDTARTRCRSVRAYAVGGSCTASRDRAKALGGSLSFVS